MSRRTYSDVAPFGVHGLIDGPAVELDDAELCGDTAVIHGWVNTGGAVDCGAEDKLLGTEVTFLGEDADRLIALRDRYNEDDFDEESTEVELEELCAGRPTVFLVNEADNPDDETDLAAFSVKEEDICKFIADLKLKKLVKKSTSVQQVL